MGIGYKGTGVCGRESQGKGKRVMPYLWLKLKRKIHCDRYFQAIHFTGYTIIGFTTGISKVIIREDVGAFLDFGGIRIG
jgi:hypothetical protein